MEKRIESIEEYKQIVKEYRKYCRRPYSNNYFMPDDILRYIELSKAYYTIDDKALIIYIDEELYWRVCFYANPEIPFVINPRDKKMVVRNVYKASREDDLLCIEKSLEKSGFVKEGTTVQVLGNVEEMLAGLSKMDTYAKRWEKKGYVFKVLDGTMYDDAAKILLKSNIIHDYQIDFKTDEEKAKLPVGTCLGIVNSDNELCGACLCDIKNGYAKGIGIAIEEPYKMNGFAPILTYHRLSWLKENGISLIEGWILINNVDSIKYHRRLGYRFTEKYADEWILK